MAHDDTSFDTIFCGAIAIASSEDRAAFISRACGSDEELRRRVERLVDAHFQAGSFLESPPASATLSVGSALSTEVAGTVIGPYKLLQSIGEGGMGTVYMAEQTQPVRRTVALKLIKAGMDSRQVLARFGAERQALALMDHPNIARVFDAGTTDSGRTYFVMELVKGIPITRFCDERRLTLRERLELAIPVCQAVQHAHQKGIIHRDLKPSNVLIALYDGKPVPKVIDFGVAKATGPRLTDQTLYTEFGAVVGTLEYMSPEQAELNQLDIDTRSDIYSLGVLLYELLTGSTPLEHKRLKEAVFLEILRVIREEESPRPSLRLSTTEELPSIAACRHVEPRKLSGLVRGELDWIVMKALEKDRNRRYETANGLAADLRRYLDDEPVQACPPSAWYRFDKFARRNKAALIAAVLISMAMLATVGMLAVSNVLITREKNQKEAALILAKDSAKAAGDQRGFAIANEKIANEQTQVAKKRAEDLAWGDYINRVNRAYREVQNDNTELAEDLLHGCPPEFRGWEWHYVKRLYNLARLSLATGRQSINALAYSPDGSTIVSGSGPHVVRIGTHNIEGDRNELDLWDGGTGQRRWPVQSPKTVILSVAFNPDGTRIAVSEGGRNSVGTVISRVAVRCAKTRQIVWATQDPTLPAAMSVAFSPDGKSLAVGYGLHNSTIAGQVRLYEASAGRETAAFQGPPGGVNKLAFHPDGGRLAISGLDVVEVWDVSRRAKLMNLRGHTNWVYGVAFSADGKWLATCGWDRTIKLRDATTGDERLTIFAHEGFVLDLAFSPDSQLLASGSEDRSLRLWEVPSGRKLATFHGHSDLVQSVAFRPDGREIASGGIDGTVRVWNRQTSRPIVFERHTSWVEGWPTAVTAVVCCHFQAMRGST